MSLFNHDLFPIWTLIQDVFRFSWVIGLLRFPTISNVNTAPFAVSVSYCGPALPNHTLDANY